MEFAVHYAAALAAVVLMLVGLQTAARVYSRRQRARGAAGAIDVIASAALSSQSMLHVVKVDGRRFLVGSCGNGVALLAELRSS